MTILKGIGRGVSSASRYLWKSGKKVIQKLKPSKDTGNLFGKLNVKNISKISKQEILKKLPNGWTHTEHNGFVHVRDASGK